MQCWHLNPRPFDHESPNITTTPGQPNLTQVSIQEQYNSCRRSTVDLMKQFTTQFSQTLTVHFATQWIRLRLPTCRPRFESQAHHICFYHLVIVKVVLYLSCEKNENKQKEAGIGPFKKHVQKMPWKSLQDVLDLPQAIILTWDCLNGLLTVLGDPKSKKDTAYYV